jgi:regulation of enolase protein 1 (concanavalin A-like superfamily)
MPRQSTILSMVLTLGLAAGASAGQPFDSDDFHCALLQTHWDFENPLGDGTYTLVGAGSGDAWLELSLPSGSVHDAWGAGGQNESARVMQDASDTDFTIEVLWKTEPTGGFNDQGVLVEQDADDWLRFDIYHNNSSLKAFMGKTIGGANTALLNADIAAGSALAMRVHRSGDTWTMELSGDGTTFSQAGQFTQALAVTRVGVYAANPVNALDWTSEVDWFFDAGNPVDPEDPTDTTDCDEVVSVETTSWGGLKSSYRARD